MSESRTIILNGRSIAYALTRSARRRTIGLQIDHEGLSVRAPERSSLRSIERALNQRADWVTDKLNKWADKPRRDALEFVTGEALPFLGGALTLHVHCLEKGVRTKIMREGDELIVRIDPALSGDLRAATVKRALTRWFKKQAEGVYAPMLTRHAAALGKPAPKLIVREQKSRWGSCDSRGVIRMNWRLIGAEEALIDYVCAHEAAHLIERNHSTRFWAVVERLLPDHRNLRKRLRDIEISVAPF